MFYTKQYYRKLTFYQSFQNSSCEISLFHPGFVDHSHLQALRKPLNIECLKSDLPLQWDFREKSFWDFLLPPSYWRKDSWLLILQLFRDLKAMSDVKLCIYIKLLGQTFLKILFPLPSFSSITCVHISFSNQISPHGRGCFIILISLHQCLDQYKFLGNLLRTVWGLSLRICSSLSWWAQAAITKSHRLGDLKSRHLFSRHSGVWEV